MKISAKTDCWDFAKTDCWDLDGCAGRAVSGEAEWQRLWRESRRRGQSVHFDSKFSPKSHTYFFNSQNNEKLIFLLNFRVKIIVKRIKNIIKSCWPKKQFVKEDISRRRKVSKGKCKFMLVSVLQISPLFVYLCTLVDVGFISNTGLVEPYHQFFFTLYSSFSFELTFKSQ